MPLALKDAHSVFQTIPMDRKHSSFSLQGPQLASFFQQRKGRTTVIGLVFVVFLTTYVFIIHGTSFSPVLALRQSDSATTSQLDVALESVQNARVVAAIPSDQDTAVQPPPAPPSAHRHGVNAFHKSKPGQHRQRPAIKLTPEQELAAISSFIASLSHNRIPHTVDPLKPIDPEVVLDFDTHSVRAEEEVRRLVEEVWTLNPVFVYSRVSCSFHQQCQHEVLTNDATSALVRSFQRSQVNSGQFVPQASTNNHRPRPA